MAARYSSNQRCWERYFGFRGSGLLRIFPSRASTVGDFARSARFVNIDFRMPEPFPIATVQAARACLVLQQQRPDLVAAFVHATFRAYFVQGRDISQSEPLRQVLERCGADAQAVLEATTRPQIKDGLKAAVDESMARGVFGAPFIFVDGEPFWGNDRLPQIERWLASGPF